MRRCRAWAIRADVSTAAVAAGLGISARTLRAWRDTHPPGRRGRPAHRITRDEARMMRLAQLIDGPHAGIATLHAWCPAASRRAIATWRRGERRRQRQRASVLRWTRPGRVWAMDFSEPPQPIDREYGAVLHVRDLASQYHLAALPVPRTSSDAACGLLRALCATADPPLVLKLDNGSAFVSRALRAWAATAGTQLLYSPTWTPQYNGAIEASIGALATRAHHAAVAEGHPEYWTCDDLEGARVAANMRSTRRSMPTARERWDTATPISAAERRRFGVQCATIAHHPTSSNARVQQRQAIVDTLQRLGYVSITRRADLVHQLKAKPRQELRA